MNAYEIVLKSREKGRPTAVKYIEKLTESFIELHGDRRFSDDSAVIGGIGTIGGKPVTVIGIEKGADTADKIAHNFGCQKFQRHIRHLFFGIIPRRFGQIISQVFVKVVNILPRESGNHKRFFKISGFIQRRT